MSLTLGQVKMKLPVYITEKQINSSTPVEPDESLKSQEDFDSCDVNIEFFVVALMLSADSLKELKIAADNTKYPKVAFYHRGKCIDAYFYEYASDEHVYEYSVSALRDFLGIV